VVDDLIDGERDEIRDLQLDHRAGADECGPYAGPRDAGLRDWRVDYARRPEFVEQSLRNAEESAVATDVLADHEDGFVPLHLLT